MTWQLGAFTLLFLAIGGGFAWYERTRPDARIVALVATLAALAALGRIAFAALPNVKPTTDIVLISGYALGPAPGFVVGALAGLTSNFFFGQGPWTPWQMAAWGATGLVGAGLAVVTARRIRRWPLALVCAVVGFAFTAVQDVGDWVTYSDHSLAQLDVYVGKGLGFDAVHAAGCLVFALAFGPALARSIARFSRRLQVRWEMPAGTIAPVVVAVVLGAWLAGQPGRGGAATAQAAETPTSYLIAAQNADGGFGEAPGQPSTQLFSGWAALGLASEGRNLLDVIRDGHSVIDYLRAGAGSLTDPGSLERTILVLRAAGVPVSAQVAALEHDVGANGSVSDQTNLTAFAVLALRAADTELPAKMLPWLTRQEDRDGGFNFATAGGQSDVDDTGAVLEALAAGTHTAVTARAVRFVESHQDPDGGFPSSPGEGSNAQSTAWAIQGLIADGVSGGAVDRATAYLRSLIAPDGHIRYSRTSDQTPVWVTGEAIMALAGKPLPLAPAARRAATARKRSRHAERRAVAVIVKRRGGVRRETGAPAAGGRAFAGWAGIAAAIVFAPIGLG